MAAKSQYLYSLMRYVLFQLGPTRHQWDSVCEVSEL